MEKQDANKQPKLWLDFEVRAYEVDVYNRVSPVTIANYLQEAAGQHADHLGVGVNHLLEHNLTWVLTRIKFEMLQYPARYELVRVLTYPTGYDKYFVYRNFVLYNAQGTQIGQATSTWAVMDTNVRKMVGVPEMITNMPTPNDEPFVARTKGKIAKVSDPLTEESFKVRWYDLDTNQHTNNAYYIQWAIESLPEATLKTKQLQSIDLMYRLETIWKEGIVARTKQVTDENSDASSTFIHQLIRESDQKELAQATTVWA